MDSKKIDVFVSKLAADGRAVFDFVVTESRIPSPIAELFLHIIKNRDSLEVSGDNRVLINNEAVAKGFYEKLEACGYRVEPFKF